MTTRERQEREDVLRAFMESLPPPALRRVVDAERWVSHAAITGDGRCLLGHVGDARLTTDSWAYRCPEPVRATGYALRAGVAFDALCAADGIARTVAACQLFCATLLREREIAALTAFCPLAAREETPV